MTVPLISGCSVCIATVYARIADLGARPVDTCFIKAARAKYHVISTVAARRWQVGCQLGKAERRNGLSVDIHVAGCTARYQDIGTLQ